MPASFVTAEAGDLLARLQGREIWANHAAWVEANGASSPPTSAPVLVARDTSSFALRDIN